MKYKTAFRLVIKAIGVWVIAGQMSSLVYMAGMFVEVWRDSSTSYVLLGSALQMAIGCAVGLATGLYLFFGGKWIVNLAIPSNRPYCHECGYELTGNVSGVCPECGTANAPARKTPDTSGIGEPQRGE